MFFRTSLDGAIEMISPSATQFGYAPNELVGRNVTNLYADPAQRRGVIAALLDKGAVSDYPLDLRAKGGEGGIAGLRVLVAEDNRVNQLVAGVMLERFRCHVDTAASGLEAVEALERIGACGRPRRRTRTPGAGGTRKTRAVVRRFPAGRSPDSSCTCGTARRNGAPIKTPLAGCALFRRDETAALPRARCL